MFGAAARILSRGTGRLYCKIVARVGFQRIYEESGSRRVVCCGDQYGSCFCSCGNERPVAGSCCAEGAEETAEGAKEIRESAKEGGAQDAEDGAQELHAISGALLKSRINSGEPPAAVVQDSLLGQNFRSILSC